MQKDPNIKLDEELERQKNRALIAKDVEKGLGVVKAILASSDKEFQSREFILAKVLEFGLCRQRWKRLSPWLDHTNSSFFGLLQVPTEFTDFLMTLARLDIKAAAEIGVFRGASSYVAAAILQRANPDLSYSMIDIKDNIIAFEKFSKILNLKKCAPNTSDDFAGDVFDYVFIDGDHSYMGAKKDYLNLGRYATKAIALHDIHAHEYDEKGGGTVRCWDEIKTSLRQDNAVYEFAHCQDRWMGIGLAIR